MADSFQKEIPKARVNIALEVETGGALKRKEIPLKLLAMGDYSNGKGEGRVMSRERISVNKNNINSVMKDLSPSVNMVVDNKLANDGSELGIDLTFESFADFTPEKIAQEVPELKRMLAMRNLLKDLKSNLIDNGQFRRELEKIMGDSEARKKLTADLQQLRDESKSSGEKA